MSDTGPLPLKKAVTHTARERPAPIRYGVAVASVAAVLALKVGLDPFITEQSPFLMLSAAVIISAWFGGLGPGLAATVLATLGSNYLFLPPHGSFTGLVGVHGLPLLLFVVQGVLICVLVEALRVARRRAEASSLQALGDQERLRRSEERFRALVQNSSDVITVVEADGTVRYVSPAVERVSGYAPEELEGTSVFDYLHPDDLEDGRKVFAELWSRAGVHPLFEFRVPSKDGSWRQCEFVVNNLLNDPSVRGVVINQRDITERTEAEKRRRESEELYRTVVENAAENIFIVDAGSKRILEANASFFDSLGYGPEDLECGMSLYDLVDADPESVEKNTRLILEGHTFAAERRYRRKDGSSIAVEVSASAINYRGKQAMCVVAHDITERKRAEEALQRSLDALLALYEAGQILGGSLSREEIGLRLLEIVERVSGLEAAIIALRDDRGEFEERGRVGPDELLASIRESSEARAASREASEEGVLRSLEVRLSERSCERRLAAVFVPLRVRGEVIGVLEAYGPGFLREKESVETLASLGNQAASALENARLYEQLSARERKLQELVGQLITAQEEERRKVAYEVHDGVTQLAVSTHQRLQLFAEDHPPRSSEGREELEELMGLARTTIGEARRVIADLRPTTLDDFGLATAVQMQLDELRREGYDVSYEEDLGEGRLPASVETALFRVTQEALTNVRKHAGTRRLRVALERHEGALRLEIRDWGRGFDPSLVTNGGGPGERVGLSSMRERISLLGGELHVLSTPGAGTSVVAVVPLSPVEGAGGGARREHGG